MKIRRTVHYINEGQNLAIRRKFNFYNSIKTNNHHKIFTIIFVLICSLKTLSANQKLISPPANLPVEVSVDLYINKIYNINTVDETYQIDGYLEYSWVDERLKFRLP